MLKEGTGMLKRGGLNRYIANALSLPVPARDLDAEFEQAIVNLKREVKLLMRMKLKDIPSTEEQQKEMQNMIIMLCKGLVEYISDDECG